MSTQLKTYPNPDSRKNWLISVEIHEPIKLKIRMVPDKLVADHTGLKSYLREIVRKDWITPEEMTLTLIESINNDLIPKWLEVIYQHKDITIKLEDQQPGLTAFTAPTY